MKKRSVSRKLIVSYLDDYLKTASIEEDSLNGLQVEGSARVEKAILAVDACRSSISAAARTGASLLIVHHGLFWGRRERITGVMRKRIAMLLKHGISLYAVHIPLDCHEEVGNNVQLARILGMEPRAKFARYKGTEIGIIAALPKPTDRTTLLRRIESDLGSRPAILPFGRRRIRRVGIVSGGGAAFATEAVEAGCDTFLTGESSHQIYHVAREAGMNMIYAGHYATETVGLRALADHLEETFGLRCRFLDVPTGF